MFWEMQSTLISLLSLPFPLMYPVVIREGLAGLGAACKAWPVVFMRRHNSLPWHLLSPFSMKYLGSPGWPCLPNLTDPSSTVLWPGRCLGQAQGRRSHALASWGSLCLYIPPSTQWPGINQSGTEKCYRADKCHLWSCGRDWLSTKMTFYFVMLT